MDASIIELENIPNKSLSRSNAENIPEDQDEPQDLPRILRFLAWFKRWPPIALALVHIILGSGILLLPALIDYFFFVKDGSQQFFSLESNIMWAGVPMSYWFIYLSIMWAIHIATNWVVLVLPAAIKRLVKFFLGKTYVARVRPQLEYIVQLRRYISFCITMVLSLVLAAILLFRVDENSRILMNRILASILSLSVGLLLEKLLLQFATVNFHRTAYSDRIIRTKFVDYVIERLYAAKKKRKAAKEGHDSSSSLQPWWTYLGNSGSENDSDKSPESKSPVESPEPVTPDKKFNFFKSKDGILGKSFNFVQAVSEVTGVNSIMRATTGVLKDVTYAAIDTIVTGSSSDTDLQSLLQAKRFAKDLFNFLLETGSDKLEFKDFIPHFTSENETRRAFSLFDPFNTGKIGVEAMQAVVVKQFREKRAIEMGVDGLVEVVKSLDSVLLSIMVLVLTFVILGIFGVNLTTYLVTIGSLVITTGGLIGNAVRGVIDSIIFLFVLHPFDVDDKIEFDGNVYIVKKIRLSSSTLHRIDGQETTIANATLSSKVIYNYRRSPFQSESLTLYFGIDTPQDKLLKFEERLNEFVGENSQDYVSKVGMAVQTVSGASDTEPQGTLKVSVSINHRANFQDGVARAARKTKFILAVRDIVTDMGLKATISE